MAETLKPRPSRVLRIVLIAALVILVLVLAGWMATIILRPSLPGHAQVVAGAREQAALTGGAQVYATHCAACHSVGIGPSIKGRSELDAATISAFVRNGPGAMPAFPQTQVSDADIAAVAGWLKDQEPAPPPEAEK